MRHSRVTLPQEDSPGRVAPPTRFVRLSPAYPNDQKRVEDISATTEPPSCSSRRSLLSQVVTSDPHNSNDEGVYTGENNDEGSNNDRGENAAENNGQCGESGDRNVEERVVR